jgi:phosphatidylglycerophosphatase A
VKNLSRFIATGFYTGYAPIAPGTVGSIFALSFYVFLSGLHNIVILIIIIFVFIFGIWSAGKLEKTEGRDASVINIDEFIGMWLSLLFFSHEVTWLECMGAFFIFRFFDVLKPFPIGWSQRLPGGLGVMMDDVIAGIYTNITLRLIYYFLMR